MKTDTPRRSRIAILTALISIAALALAGCSSAGSASSTAGSSSAPVQGGTLTAAIDGDPLNLDLGSNTGALTIVVAANIFEGLFALDKTYKVRPMLAQSYTTSDNGLVYTIALRKNVPFQNGEIMNSADVVASLDRWEKVSSTGQQVATQVSSIKASGPDSVQITLSSPRYSLISDLAGTVQAAIILPAKIAEAAGTNVLTTSQIIGTGPYQLKSYTPGQGVELVKFKNYAARTENWGGTAGNKPAHVDTINYKFVTDATQRLNGLKTGQWNWVQDISSDDIETARQDPSLTVTKNATSIINTLLLNHNSSSVFANADARQALNMLLDKPAIAKATFGPSWLWNPLTPGIAAASDTPMYSTAGKSVFDKKDVAKAKSLFAKAGVGPGTTIRILSTQTYPQFYQWAVLAQSALKSIGIKAQISIYDFPTMIDLLTSEPTKWDMSMTYFDGDVTAPDQVLWLGPSWPGEYHSDAMNSLLADYQKSTTPAEATAVVDKIQSLVYKDMPVVQLGAESLTGVFSSSVHFPDAWNESFYNAWVDKK